jgi:hypothetical protein
MTPTQRRAHNILHGQTLADEWAARCKLYAEGDKLYAEGFKLRAEGRKLYTEGTELWTEGIKLCTEGSKLRAEGSKLRTEGDKPWTDAVTKEFGPGCTMTWEGSDCRLSCGEFYIYNVLCN